MDWGFLLADSTIGVVTWAGTVLTVGGLVYTIFLAKSAKTAAEQTVALIRGRDSLASVAFCYGQVTMVKTLVQTNNISHAMMVFFSLKREIFGVLSFLKDRDDLDDATKIMMQNLTAIDRLFDGQTAGRKVNMVKMMEALTGIGDFLVEREQEIKSNIGKTV